MAESENTHLKDVAIIVGSTLKDVASKITAPLQKYSVTLVIPAKDEEKNIKKVINAGKKSKYVSDILVVDSFSTDKTAEIAEKNGARVVRQHAEKRGKGGAIYTGIMEARGSILVFMDADISNITPEMIDKLVKPIIKEDVDHVIGKFKRKSGRVTRLTALPLLKLFFPEIKFEQPLSGLFAAKKSVLKNIEIEEGWGVETGIIIDIFMGDYKTEEVPIGFIEHEMDSLDHVAKIAEEITEILTRKAHEYGRVGLKMNALLIATYNSERMKILFDEKTEEILKILEKLILQIKKFGINNLIIVVGYRGELIKKRFGKTLNGLEIEYVENLEDKDVLSILSAKDKIEKRFLLLFGDMIVDPRIIERVVKEIGDVVFCVDHKKIGKKGSKALIEGDKIKNVGTFLRGNSTLLNLAICNPKFFELIEDAAENKKFSLEEALKWIAWHGEEIKICNVTGLFWNKIETIGDFKKIEE